MCNGSRGHSRHLLGLSGRAVGLQLRSEAGRVCGTVRDA